MARVGTEKAKSLLYEIARKHNTDPRSVIEGSRDREYNAVKQEFCKTMKDRGISLWVAAELLKLDRTTITYYANPEYRERKKANMRKVMANEHSGAGQG